MQAFHIDDPVQTSLITDNYRTVAEMHDMQVPTAYKTHVACHLALELYQDAYECE